MTPRSKKPPVEIKPEFELPPQSSAPPRKKKKNRTPDRPQSEWMFPPDEENPVLNSKPKSEARRLKEEKEKDQAITFLQHKSVAAPLKAPPPDLLLTLVGAFLTSHGFNSTSRLYTTELQSMKKLDARKTEVGGKLPKGFPDLVEIFKEWYKIFQERLPVDDTSSSDSDDSESTKVLKKPLKAEKVQKEAKADFKASEAAAAKVNANDITSSSGESSDEESDSDVDMKDANPAQKSTRKSISLSKTRSPSKPTSSSSSDSDADDEKDNAGAELPETAALSKPTVNGLANGTKRKASHSSSSSSESESESESDSSPSAGIKAVSVKKEKASPVVEVISQTHGSVPVSKQSTSSSSSSHTSSSDSESAAEPPKLAAATIAAAKSGFKSSSESSESESDEEAPKPKLPTTTATKAGASSSSSSASDSTSSDAESSALDFSNPPKPTLIKTTKIITAKPTQASSDSSVTLQATPVAKSSAINTGLSSDSSTSADQQTTTTVTTTTISKKRKHSSSPTRQASKFAKKQNTPFQRVPQDTPVDPKMASNAYRSYDYAERAHQDLSVTRGKGFTKEKNKKKRGSYRGGAIDVSGGKGIKFED